jgi:hypothetical protein
MIPALLLVICVVAYRVAAGLLIHSGAAPWLSNFAPFAAIVLCCAAYLPRYYKFTLPFVTLLISDAILDFNYGAQFFTWHVLGRYLALALVGLLGWALQNRASLKTMLPASVLSSLIFYLVTNAFSWATDPGYAKSLAGFMQALTTGLSQYGATPTWMFFRNSLVSDFIFTAAFVLLMRAESVRARETAALARAH